MLSHSENGGVGVNFKSKGNSHHANHHRSDAPNSLLVRFCWQLFVYSYGILIWLLYLLMALKSGTFFKRSTEKEKNDVIIARDAFWNLSKQPLPGYHHDFFKARDGFQLHYICNHDGPTTGKDLVILIHGFPNTCMTWRLFLKEPALPTNAVILAVDLPGYGGSDSLPRYNTQVLEYMTEFIAAMREKYGTDGDSVCNNFVVGHDWGCVVTLRLAVDAPCLADRYIVSNGALLELVRANVERSINSSRMIFRQFYASPRNNFGCLAKSYQALKPLLQQLGLSGYIFVFQLPSLFVKTLFEGGNLSFLRAIFRAEHESSEGYRPHETMSANMGPSVEECKTVTKGGLTYGSSVPRRTRSIGETFWQATAYYRDGLGTEHWDKSIETIAVLYNLDSDLSASESPSRRRSSSASSTLFTDQVKGSIRAPVTMLWSEHDLALTKAMCLDGLNDYLAKESEVFLLTKPGHWIQVDSNGRKLLAHVIALFATGSSKLTPSYVASEVQKFDGTVSLVAKK